jgi:leucyl aminopeptidase (aminopeptidase T)
VADALKKVSEIHVKTELGTDITFPIKKRKIIQSTGVLRKIGESGNIPSGEVYMAPVEEKANGVVVFDGSIAGIGLLKDPVTVEFINGYAEKISGKVDARVLSRFLNKEGQLARNLGEFGIGTNYKAELCGDILEDEKVLGTIHFAFGNNISMGGSIDVPLHIDGIVLKPTVYADGKLIMEEGKLLID